MNILYVSNVCSNDEYNLLFKNKEKFILQQAQKFNLLLVQGLSKDSNVTVLSGRPINKQIHKKFFYKKKSEIINNVKFNYLSFFNIKFVRQFLLYVGSKKFAKKWLKKNPDGIMICDVLNFSIVKAALSVFKKKNKTSIAIVTDLPEILNNNPKSKMVKLFNQNIYSCDKYVFLTDQMSERINYEKKPYIVIEGFCDIDMNKIQTKLTEKYSKKTILYAGLLHKKYGIKLLVHAFIAANIENSELHIYGTGDFEHELREIVKNTTNIKYFGSVNNSKVVEEQLKATLLVNPRPTNEEFVKYSFPSKNMEYIASGTPLLTTNLPGMPKEYRDYCFILEEETIPALSLQLKEILSLDEIILFEKGEKAKKWILENKNNIIQAQKITSMVNE